MIKATELRVGNLTWKDSVIVTIDGRSIMDIQFSEAYAEKYSPINLTEDWFMKLGFQKDAYDHFKHKSMYNSFVKKYDTDIYFLRVADDADEPEVRYVHQLQNLFWCLVAEEITINP